MTPKEKAEELFEKFTEVDGYDFNIKQCALIVVDEILTTCVESMIYYWQEVKQEIEKL